MPNSSVPSPPKRNVSTKKGFPQSLPRHPFALVIVVQDYVMMAESMLMNRYDIDSYMPETHKVTCRTVRAAFCSGGAAPFLQVRVVEWQGSHDLAAGICLGLVDIKGKKELWGSNCYTLPLYFCCLPALCRY